MDHDQHERTHQGQGHMRRLPAVRQDNERAGLMQCRERLGGHTSAETLSGSLSTPTAPQYGLHVTTSLTPVRRSTDRANIAVGASIPTTHRLTESPRRPGRGGSGGW